MSYKDSIESRLRDRLCKSPPVFLDYIGFCAGQPSAYHVPGVYVVVKKGQSVGRSCDVSFMDNMALRFVFSEMDSVDIDDIFQIN